MSCQHISVQGFRVPDMHSGFESLLGSVLFSRPGSFTTVDQKFASAKPALKLRPLNRTTLPFQYVLSAFALVVVGCFALRGFPCRSEAHRSRGCGLKNLEPFSSESLCSGQHLKLKSEMTRRLPLVQRRRCTCG